MVGSRDTKPISSDALLKQLDNYQSVLKRGYPYRFDSVKQFNAFKKDVLDAVEQAGLPKDKVVLQGSALRKANADDLDLAILLNDDSYMSKVVDTFKGYVKLSGGEKIDISKMSGAELHGLADNILSDKTHTVYNATARTFALAVKSGKMRPNEIEALNSSANEISKTFNSKTSMAVMAERSQFNIEPFMELLK